MTAKEIFNNCIGSWKHIPYTWKHYLAFMKLQKKLLGHYKYKTHDWDKLIMYALCPWLGTKRINKIHRKNNRHHPNNKHGVLEHVEALIDWECARFTKPDKPLNAWQTMEEFYPELKEELIPYFKELGLSPFIKLTAKNVFANYTSPNGRIYPKATFEKQIKEYVATKPSGSFIGEISHPTHSGPGFEVVGMDESNGDLKLQTLDTPNGEDIRRVLEYINDFKINASFTGSVDPETNKVTQVDEIHSFDFVQPNILDKILSSDAKKE